LSFTIVWDAISDPVIGYIIKGCLVALWTASSLHFDWRNCVLFGFLFLWIVPEGFTEPVQRFGFWVAANMVAYSVVTVFIVSHAESGFAEEPVSGNSD